ncbi:MAG: hypothetical protein A2X88_02125 [Deltaproteobacteria bacterium GWC2_65_14]|nr:MAG: hypothetical protein A2X88_02125 [Deltaproteobacteria bacterium GWC2_65_14]
MDECSSSRNTAMSKWIESYGTDGLTFPRSVFVFLSSTSPNSSRIDRSAETFLTSLWMILASS